MIFRTTALPGVWRIEPERHADDRGHFARTFCAREFAAHGLSPLVAQASVSFNRLAGTVRGMHWAAPPSREAKLVRCARGAIFDAVVDVRAGSPTFGHLVPFELSAGDGVAVYVPPGVAHGFQTLEPETEVAYQMSEAYAPGQDRGFRYDDPAVAVPWPLPVTAISERDLALPAFPRTGAGR